MFDKKFDFQGFRKELQEATKALEEKYGVKFDFVTTPGRYTDNQFTSKYTCTSAKVNGQTFNVNEDTFKREAHWYDLDPKLLHKEFTYKGKRYRIDGMLPRRRKNNILIKSLSDGKDGCGSPDFIKKFAK